METKQIVHAISVEMYWKVKEEAGKEHKTIGEMWEVIARAYFEKK